MKYQEQRAVESFLPYRDYIKGAAFRVAPIPGYSEDIVQQVFIEFVSHWDRWDLDADLRPILLAITRNVALRLLQEKKRQLPETVLRIGECFQHRAEEKLEPTCYEDEKSVLTTCLNHLPKRSRALIDLYYFDALSSDEIGRKYGLTAKAVTRAIHRIRERLRKCIHRALERNQR